MFIIFLLCKYNNNIGNLADFNLVVIEKPPNFPAIQYCLMLARIVE